MTSGYKPSSACVADIAGDPTTTGAATRMAPLLDDAIQGLAARVERYTPGKAPPSEAVRLGGAHVADAATNVACMHTLERVSAAIYAEGIPLAVLGGTALNLVAYTRPDQRPMQGLDLHIAASDLPRAHEALVMLGAVRADALPSDAQLARAAHRARYRLGQSFPVRIDLHLQPMLSRWWSRKLTDADFLAGSRRVRMGEARVLLPAPETMLIHLAVQRAIGWDAHAVWRRDIHAWVEAHRSELDWDRFVERAQAWGVALPVYRGLHDAELGEGRGWPQAVMQRLRGTRAGWRDHVALVEGPGAARPAGWRALMHALCTPGLRGPFEYLARAAWPGEDAIANGYHRRHPGWTIAARLARLGWPVIRRVRRLRAWVQPVETRPSAIHGTGLYAIRALSQGEVVVRDRGMLVDRDGPCVIWARDASGFQRRFELTGPARFVNHACRPNAVMRDFDVVALRTIPAGQEITMDYGPEACTCRQHGGPHAEVNA